jgi:hypothetical protein
MIEIKPLERDEVPRRRSPYNTEVVNEAINILHNGEAVAIDEVFENEGGARYRALALKKHIQANSDLDLKSAVWQDDDEKFHAAVVLR